MKPEYLGDLSVATLLQNYGQGDLRTAFFIAAGLAALSILGTLLAFILAAVNGDVSYRWRTGQYLLVGAQFVNLTVVLIAAVCAVAAISPNLIIDFYTWSGARSTLLIFEAAQYAATYIVSYKQLSGVNPLQMGYFCLGFVFWGFAVAGNQIGNKVIARKLRNNATRYFSRLEEDAINSDGKKRNIIKYFN